MIKTKEFRVYGSRTESVDDYRSMERWQQENPGLKIASIVPFSHTQTYTETRYLVQYEEPILQKEK